MRFKSTFCLLERGHLGMEVQGQKKVDQLCLGASDTWGCKIEFRER